MGRVWLLMLASSASVLQLLSLLLCITIVLKKCCLCGSGRLELQYRDNSNTVIQ